MKNMPWAINESLWASTSVSKVIKRLQWNYHVVPTTCANSIKHTVTHPAQALCRVWDKKKIVRQISGNLNYVNTTWIKEDSTLCLLYTLLTILTIWRQNSQITIDNMLWSNFFSIKKFKNLFGNVSWRQDTKVCRVLGN